MSKSEKQPYALRGPNSPRDTLSVAGDAERPVQDARRAINGRAEGK